MSGSSLINFEPSSINLFITNLCNRKCPFCYLNDWVKNDDGEARHMTLKDLGTFILWLKKSGINNVKLAGGEPTLHPNLLDFIHEFKRSNIHVEAVLTNGLGKTEVYREVADLTGANWLVNIASQETYTQDEWELINKNLEVLKWKNENASVCFSGFDTSSLRRLCLSITFYKPNQNFGYIIDLAKKYSVPVIRYDVSRPSATKSNVFVDFDSLYKIKPTLMDFVRECVREGVKPGLDDALPFCIFTQEELKYLFLFSTFPSICMPVLDVMPDLSISYCASMRGILPSYDIQKMTASKIFKELIICTEDHRNFQLARCYNCYNSNMNLCQGYCLRYKSDFLENKNKNNKFRMKIDDLIGGLTALTNRKKIS